VKTVRVAQIAVVLACAYAPPAGAETLREALALTYWNNPEVNAERAQVRATDESVPLAKSQRRPRVDATAGITGTSTSSRRGGMESSDDRVDGSVGVSVTQPIFQGWRGRNAIKEAYASVLGARQTLENVVQNRLFDAAEAYMDVLRDRAITDLRRRNIAFLEEQLRAAQARFDVGENTITDVAQTRARLAQAQADVTFADAALTSSEATYRQVVGQMPGRLTEQGVNLRSILPRSLRLAIDISQRENPAIIAAQHEVDAAAYDLKQIEGELLPTVSLEGSFDRQFGIDNDDYQNTTTLSGRLSVPIYQGGEVSARVRQAKEILGLRRIQVDVARDQVRALVQSAYGQYESSGSAIIAASAAVEAANIALNAVQEEQRVGQRTQLDVLDAQQDLLNARVNLVTAQRDRVVAAFQILLAIGFLTPEKLALRVERYHPEEHYEAVKDKWYGLRTPDGR